MIWAIITLGIFIRLLTTINFRLHAYKYELSAVFIFLLFVFSYTIVPTVVPKISNYSLQDLPLFAAIFIAVIFVRQLASDVDILRSLVFNVVAIYLFVSTFSIKFITGSTVATVYLCLIGVYLLIALNSLWVRTLPIYIRYIGSILFLSTSIISYFIFSYELFVLHAAGELDLVTSFLFGYVSLQFYAFIVYLFLAILPTPASEEVNIQKPTIDPDEGFENASRKVARYGSLLFMKNILEVKHFLQNGMSLNNPQKISPLKIVFAVLSISLLLALNLHFNFVDALFLACTVLTLISLPTKVPTRLEDRTQHS